VLKGRKVLLKVGEEVVQLEDERLGFLGNLLGQKLLKILKILLL